MRFTLPLTLVIFFIGVTSANSQKKFTFQSDGKMLSAENIESTNYEFKVLATGDFLKNQLLFPVKNILTFYNKLNTGDTKKLKEEVGFTDSELEVLKKDMATLLNGLSPEVKQFFSIEPIRGSELNSTCCTHVPYDLRFTTDKIYSLEIDHTTHALQYSAGAYSHTTSNPFSRYALRFAKPEYFAVSEWMKLHPLPSDYSDNVNVYNSKKKTFNDITAKIKTLNDDINGKLPGTLTSNDITAFLQRIRAIKINLAALALDLKTLTDYVKGKKDFISRWLWYTNGEPVLNPFSQFQTTKKPPEDSIAYYKKRSEVITALITQKNEISEGDIKNLSKLQADLDNKLTRLQKELNDFNSQEVSRKNLLQKDILLYEGLVQSDKNVITFHHDASNKFNLLSEYEKEVSEDEKVVVMIENKTKNVNIDVTTKMNTETSITGDIFENVNLSSVFNLAPLLTEEQPVGDDPTVENLSRQLSELQKDHVAVTKTINALDVHFSKTFIPKAELVEKDLTSAFKSESVVLTDTIEAPRKVSYTLTEEGSTKSFKFNFRYTKLYWVLPSAGVVYSFDDVDENSFSDGHITSENRTGYISTAGLKLYPWRTSLRDPYFIYSEKRRQRHFDYRKLHGYLGVGLKEPTKNFLFGIGADLWSGFNINIGFHLIRLEQPRIENNAQVGSNDYTKWSPYAGLAIDPVVFVKLFSLIFPN